MVLFGNNTERSVDPPHLKPAPVRVSDLPADLFGTILTYSVLPSQFSDSQTSSSYPFSSTSPQTRTLLDPMHGSVSCIV